MCVCVWGGGGGGGGRGRNLDLGGEPLGRKPCSWQMYSTYRLLSGLHRNKAIIG